MAMLIKSCLINTILSLLIAIHISGCRRNEVVPRQAAAIITTASEQIVGDWKLVSIRSGWTGKPIPLSQKYRLVVDNRLQAVLFLENGEEIANFNISLSQLDGNLIHYDLTDQTLNNTYILPKTGLIQVYTQELVFDNTALDGPAYTFARK